MPQALSATLSGLGFGLSLIIAIGAQNAFILRQGLRREHVFTVVTIAALSDALLIALGVLGVGALIVSIEWLLAVIELAGGLFLLLYGVFALKRVFHPATLDAAPAGAALSLPSAVATILALTYLNPHVYLDTVLLLGSIAGTWSPDQWWFAGGAMAGSILWFSALGFGARFLQPLFRSRRAWQVLDMIIAIIMFALSASLLARFVEDLTRLLAS